VGTKITIKNIVSNQECYETIRELRWSEGIHCVNCESEEVKFHGGTVKKRYLCNSCGKSFDDLTGTIFSGSKEPLKTWVLGLYFIGINLSNTQIGEELDISENTTQSMTEQLGSLEEIMYPYGEVIFLSVKALMRRAISLRGN